MDMVDDGDIEMMAWCWREDRDRKEGRQTSRQKCR